MRTGTAAEGDSQYMQFLRVNCVLEIVMPYMQMEMIPPHMVKIAENLDLDLSMLKLGNFLLSIDIFMLLNCVFVSTF